MLSVTRTEDFRQAYKESYGEEISIEEAREMALRVMLLYEFLARPLPGKEEDDHLHLRWELDLQSSLPADECFEAPVENPDHPS
jgi:hypothetical protein